MEKRFSHGLQVLSHYTFAHAYKYDSSYYPDDPAVAYGPDDQVRNHVWVNNVVYELPFGKGKMFAGNSHRAEDLIIGGWQITGTTTWGSGLPWTPSTNECGGEEDVGVCRPDKGSGSFPIGAGSLQHPASGSPFVQFFTPLTSLTGPFTDPGHGEFRQHRGLQLPRTTGILCRCLHFEELLSDGTPKTSVPHGCLQCVQSSGAWVQQ